MYVLVRCSALMVAAALCAGDGRSAAAQAASDLKARCDQLIDFFDRYGSGRSENSDGYRNHTRIGAGIDCKNGRYAEGIATMEALLKRKRFDVPPPPAAKAAS